LARTGCPVALKWIRYDPHTDSHPGDLDDYFEELRQGVLSASVLPVSTLLDGSTGVLYVRPASDFDVTLCLKVEFKYRGDEAAFALRVDDVDVSRELLEKVIARDLMLHGPENAPRLIAAFQFPGAEEPPDFRLSLELTMDGRTSYSNLIGSTLWQCSRDGCEVYATVSPELIALVDRFGRRALEATLAFGQVERCSPKKLENLTVDPKRLSQLRRVPKELADHLDRPFGGE